MLTSSGVNSTPGPDPLQALTALDPGDQALVELPGQEFDYSSLPDRAFDNLLIVTVGRTVSDVETALRDQDCDLNKIGVIPIGVTEDNYSGPLWHTDTVYPSDLTGISIAFSQALNYLKEERGWVVLDAVNILFMYADPDRLFRLIDDIGGQIRNNRLHGVYTVDPSSIDSRHHSRLQQIAGTTISLNNTE